MKAKQVVPALVGIIIALVVAFEIGLRSQRPHLLLGACPSNDVCIAISDLGNGKCEAKYPVAVIHYNGRVQWTAPPTKQYWVSFLQIRNLPDPTYTPEFPLIDPQNPALQDPVLVDGAATAPPFYHVKQKNKYYYYAIFDHKPTSPSGACKEAGSDHDTGLNVKP